MPVFLSAIIVLCFILSIKNVFFNGTILEYYLPEITWLNSLCWTCNSLFIFNGTLNFISNPLKKYRCALYSMTYSVCVPCFQIFFFQFLTGAIIALGIVNGDGYKQILTGREGEVKIGDQKMKKGHGEHLKRQ